MYSSIEISGFRSLEQVRLEGLSRVNLLVGSNNSGKTSVLECVGLLHSAADYRVLRSVLELRGEWLPDEDQGRVYDIAQLFSYRNMSERIRVSGQRSGSGSQLGAVTAELSVQMGQVQIRLPLHDDAREAADESPGRLVWTSSERKGEFQAALTADGMLPVRQPARHGWGADDDVPRVQFVGTGGLVPGDVGDIFDDVVLTDAEDGAVEAMRLIEPRVERLAVLASRRAPLGSSARGGILLRMQGVDGRVPIGSVGDGMWRLLGLALALARARGGVLLVDEIDTGLHYTVMQKMWTMLAERSRSLDVQVFATTHSRDCYESLASVADPDAVPPGDLTIHRIEPENGRSGVSFGEHEVVVAAERGLEVR
ncbi:AAA family ATPase [Candidatus Poriferisodalis sp.]|uniref:AAA family ATPase n=1 Tax=Candidatus Poriferisodalis sp. TaxID=3101277 RepID=UPI003B526172